MENPTLYEKILNKPKSYRRKLSYIITALIGVLIFTIWIIMTTLSMQEVFNFENTEDGTEEASFPEDFEAPSFYKEGDLKSMEENFNTQMQQQEQQDSSLEEKNTDL